MTRRARLFVAVALAAAAVAALAWALSVSGREDDDPPWCVWAVPGPTTVRIGGATVTAYGSVSSRPGDDVVRGDWFPGGMRYGPRLPEPTLSWRAPSTTMARMLLRVPTAEYRTTADERTGADGRTWRAFVRALHWSEVRGGAPDPRHAGTWEIRDVQGGVARIELLPDGGVRGGGVDPRWSVRDGAIVVIDATTDAAGEVDVGVLSEDGESWSGDRDGYLPVSAKRVR